MILLGSAGSADRSIAAGQLGIELYDAELNFVGWLLLVEGVPLQLGGMTFTYHGLQYSGLMVSSDPGAPFLWAAALLFLLGADSAFLFPAKTAVAEVYAGIGYHCFIEIEIPREARGGSRQRGGTNPDVAWNDGKPGRGKNVNLEMALFRAGEYSLLVSVFVSLLAALTQRAGRKERSGRRTRVVLWIVRTLALVSLCVLTALVVARTVRTGHSPFSNMYEFSVVFVWGIVLMGTVFLWKHGNYIISLLASLAAVLLLFFAGTLSMQSKPLVPALQNNLLLTLHVFSAVIAYGAFTLGFIVSVLQMIQKDDRFAALPSEKKLERIGYQTVLISFPMMTLVIVLGAIWADIAWGVFWSWDPKETASLVTWLIYAGYLHTRVLKKWRGRAGAVLLIIGFAAVIFTFFGNYIFGGLHAYA